MSAAAPSYRLPGLRPNPQQPTFTFFRGWLPSGWRRSRSGFRQGLSAQAELLRRCAEAESELELDGLHRQAAANQRAVLEQLRGSLFTPFDSEDIADLVVGITRTVRCQQRLRALAPGGLPTVDAVVREWSACLASLIPVLPEPGRVDGTSGALRGFDSRLRRALRRERVRIFHSSLDFALVLETQEADRRLRQLHDELRWLTRRTLAVRYRNG